jgi:hypothetical protein
MSITQGIVVVSARGAEIKLLSSDRILLDDMVTRTEGHDLEIWKFGIFFSFSSSFFGGHRLAIMYE